MINDLMQFIRDEAGIELAPEVSRRVLARASQAYGGERVYVAKLPKLDRQERIQAAKAAKREVREVAKVAGISERHARRILHGK